MTKPIQPTRRSVLKAGSALTIGAQALGSQAFGLPRTLEDGEPRRPNVLWIISDQHRPDVAGFAGNTHAHTPELDRFAGQSAVLRDTYCQIPLCVPARQSLLTTLHAHQHGSFRNWEFFPHEQSTLATAFKASGYRTALLGKSHCNKSGFDLVRTHNERFDELRAENDELRMPGSHFYRANDCPYSMQLAQMNPRCVGPNEGPKFYMEEVVCADAEEYLAAESDEPFFLWASLLNPHPPLFPPPEFLDLFRERDLPTRKPISDAARRKLFEADQKHYNRSEFGTLTEDDYKGITRAYYASVAWTDACVGRLLATLDRFGLAENTIVVYTSDHGEMLGDQGLFQKGTFFEGAVRVPAIVRYPGRVVPRTLPHVFQHIDLSRSVLELAGIPVPEGSPARSCVDLLTDKPEAEWDDTAYSELVKGGILNGVKIATPFKGDKLQQMVRRGNLKYVEHNKYERALYDLAEDPNEEHNRIDDKSLAQSRDELKRYANEQVPVTFRILGSGRK